MDLRNLQIVVFGVVLSTITAQGQFKIPDVKLEALSPKGFRVSIPDRPGIQLFAFHGNINQQLQMIEPGEYTKDVKAPLNNFWVYYDPDVELRVGDTIHYWIFVQHDRLGYRRDRQIWKVTELVGEKELKCNTKSITITSIANEVCQGFLIFEDKFDRFGIDTSRWVIEQYIPTYKRFPDFEFNSYQNNEKSIYFKDNKLYLFPQAMQDENDVRGTLNLRIGCTSKNGEECFYSHFSSRILPPIRSAKIRTVHSIKYGTIEIRAKLPLGDWIYPVIRVIPVNETLAVNNQIFFVYSRGNRQLFGNDGSNIGSSMLFSGPVLTYKEPERSRELRSRLNAVPYGEEMHKYTMIWSPSELTFEFDGGEYGKIQNPDKFYDFESYVTFGVAVGGVNDFPEGFKSGNDAKPWINNDRLQVSRFFRDKVRWFKTWTDEDPALVLDYVRIWAI